MTNKIDETIAIDSVNLVAINLNIANNGAFQITCNRTILGGYGTVRRYMNETHVREVLRSFGFEDELVDDRLKTLRGINGETVRPFELVKVGERAIPDAVLHRNGFFAV